MLNIIKWITNKFKKLDNTTIIKYCPICDKQMSKYYSTMESDLSFCCHECRCINGYVNDGNDLDHINIRFDNFEVIVRSSQEKITVYSWGEEGSNGQEDDITALPYITVDKNFKSKIKKLMMLT